MPRAFPQEYQLRGAEGYWALRRCDSAGGGFGPLEQMGGKTDETHCGG
jgi:hypothetical protein